MTAVELLKAIPHVPMTRNGNLCIKTSNSERRRWLERRSVCINGQYPGPDDKIFTPVWEVVIFAKSSKRTTLWFCGIHLETANG